MTVKVDRRFVDAVLSAPELRRVSGAFRRLERLAVRIHAAPAIDLEKLPLGASRFGGVPDVPLAFNWPYRTLVGPPFTPGGTGLPAAASLPLPFVGQIDLADVAPVASEAMLPSFGHLYFFWDETDYPGFIFLEPSQWRVVYSDAPRSQLVRTQIPPLVPPTRRYQTHALTFSNVWTLPSVETTWIAEDGETLGGAVKLTEEEWSAYAQLRDECRSDARRLIPEHQLLGYGDDVQPCACENAYLNVRPSFFPALPSKEILTAREQALEFQGCRLLLQVGIVDEMEFGRDGRLFFFIRDEDLKRRDFAKVFCWVQ